MSPPSKSALNSRNQHHVLVNFGPRTPNHGAASTPQERIKPGIPDEDRRYTPHRNPGQFGNVVIAAGKPSLAVSLPPNLGWESFIHPEGSVFYCWKERVKSESIKIITDAYLSDDPKLADDILSVARDIMKEADDMVDDQTELVVNTDPQNPACYYYYFVDHTRRCLFWHVKVNMEDIFGEHFKGVTDIDQTKYLLEQYYWCHLEFYPHDRILSPEIFNELRGLLNYSKADLVLSDTSLSPFTQEEVTSLLSLVDSLKDDVNTSNEYSFCVVALIIRKFAETRFVNFFGQKYARLDAAMFIFGEDEQEHWLYKTIMYRIVNILLFTLFRDHVSRLKRVWADHIIINPRWKDFVISTTNELSRCTIFSTVILTANFAFLAVPGVTDPTKPNPSPPQIIIYASALLSMGSVVLSLALLNVYSDPELLLVNVATTAMKSVSKKVKMASLAFTHSLPMALLAWSILLFFVALAVEIFTSSNNAMVTILGVVCGFLVFMVAWSVRTLRAFR